MDAGRAIVALTQLEDRPKYDVINIGGELVPSIEHWLKEIANIAGAKPAISITPKTMVKMLGRFIPVMREVASMSYKYEKTITLNDEKFRTRCPQFKFTSMDYAIKETLQWFQQHGTISSEARSNRRKARAAAIWAFAVDNIAIGLFPVAIGFAVAQIPAIQNAAIYIAVAAGIYWTPSLHKLANTVKPRQFRVD